MFESSLRQATIVSAIGTIAMFAGAPSYAAPQLPDVGKPAAAPAGKVAERQTNAELLDPLEQDERAMRGTWFREFVNPAGVRMRVEKKVDHGSDVVTEFDGNHNVVHAHASTYELSKHGPLRVFTIKSSVNTAGPNMGLPRPANRSYVYRIEGDRFIEAWGLLETDRGPPLVIIWQRVNPAKAE